METPSVGNPLLWISFIAFIVAMIVLDFAVFNRRARKASIRAAAGWVVFWVSLAAAFAVGVFVKFGSERGLEFVTAYLVEYSLSVDNLFVFLILFSYFAVPAAVQHRVLFWGILGAIILRGVFIVAGAVLIHRFNWVLYVFGVILVVTGVRLLFKGDEQVDPERNPILRLFRRFVPTTGDYRDAKFLVREGGRLLATPLLTVLVVVESTDVVFAVDSIPAVFVVTQDAFIVYTSNIFAILGLRAMFFVLAGMLGRFRYLSVGLAAVLVFIGGKMLVKDVYRLPFTGALGIDGPLIVPTGISLVVVAAILAVSVIASLVRERARPTSPEA